MINSLLTKYDQGSIQNFMVRIVEPGVLEWVFVRIKNAAEWLEPKWNELSASQMADQLPMKIFGSAV